MNIDELKELEDQPLKPTRKNGKPVKDPVYKIKLLYSSETESITISNGVKPEDMIIVESRYGKDIARVLGIVKNPQDLVEEDLINLVRICNDKDLKKLEENQAKEKKAYDLCKEKILSLGLDMKLTGVHYLLDEPKILFYFTADSRVDFRELVKSLVSVFKMRIELRQIGVRDEARLLGAMGVCGRIVCCHGVTDDLKPVSIKMAKEQNLSLNSMKISGPCGRLLCCLEYEYNFYEEEKSKLPTQGTKIKYLKELFNIDDVNLFTKTITLSSHERSFVKVPFDNVRKIKGKWELLKLDGE